MSDGATKMFKEYEEYLKLCLKFNLTPYSLKESEFWYEQLSKIKKEIK